MLKGAALENTILWNDVVIGEGSFLRDCIVTDGVTLSGAFVGKVLTTDCP
jgi:NDP-sugar pyrophosphorylase family protein